MHLKFRTFFVIFLFFILFNYNFSFAAPESNVKATHSEKNIVLNNIIVKNNQRVDTETVISYLGLKTGDKVNYKILNTKLKKMYKLGLFSDIKFRVSNNNLIVLIKENPMINNVNFVGNKKIKEDIMRKEIKLNSRNVYKKEELHTREVYFYRKGNIGLIMLYFDEIYFDFWKSKNYFLKPHHTNLISLFHLNFFHFL